MLNLFYATDLFLYPLKISGGIERDQWHEMDYADNYPLEIKYYKCSRKHYKSWTILPTYLLIY